VPAVGFVFGLAGSAGFMAFCVVRGQQLGMASPSVLLLAYGVTVIGLRVALPTVADRHHPLRVLSLACIVIAAGLTTASIAGSSAVLLTSATVIGVGVGLLTPAFFAAVFARAGAHERGAASGTASMAIDVGLGGGPMVVGALASAATLPAAFGVAAAVAVIGSVWALAVGRRTAGEKQRHEPHEVA